MDGKSFVEVIVKEEKYKLNFQEVYVYLNMIIFFVGSSLPKSRSIKTRFREHFRGHKSHSKILTNLMESSKEEAKDAFNNLYFLFLTNILTRVII